MHKYNYIVKYSGLKKKKEKHSGRVNQIMETPLFLPIRDGIKKALTLRLLGSEVPHWDLCPPRH